MDDGEPLAKDNFQLIHGIGPTVEKRLHGHSIYTFRQLAALSPADIAAAIADFSGLSAERIIKQDWIGQAGKLAAGEVEVSAESEQDTSDAVPDEPPDSTEVALSAPLFQESEVDVEPQKQHRPGTFTIEFLLDENSNVDSTHVLHIQSGREHTWAGWQKTQLVDFFIESAELNVSQDEPAIPAAEESVNTEEIETDTVKKPDLMADEVAESTSPSSPASLSRLSGVLRLREFELIGVKSGSFRRPLVQNEPFDVQLTLDLTELKVPENTLLNYKASIYGKGNRSGLLIGETQGSIMPADTVTVRVERNTLPEEGTYQLTARVIASLPARELRARPGTTAVIDGGQVQVF